MTPFQMAWSKTGKAEGGYVNDPSDSGGETNHGITIAVARANGYLDAMIDMTPEQAEAIAKKAYWDVLNLDAVAEISVAVALEVFDTGFNMGQGRVAKFFQRALNVFNRNERDYADIKVDGALGRASVASMKALFDKRGQEAEKVLYNALNCLQGVGYIALAERRPKDEKFMWGWYLHRVGLK